MVNLDDFEVGDTVGFCPECGGELVLRDGKYGLFVGCTNYPECRKTYRYDRFRVKEDILEMKDLEKTDSFQQIRFIRDTTGNERVKKEAETKMIKREFCECGEKFHCNKIYRTTPDYPHYLKEVYCPHCGTYVITETPDYASFCRMGSLESSGEEEITGGYWL